MEQDKKITKIVQIRIGGFDGYVSRSQSTKDISNGKKYNQKAAVACKKNFAKIDQAVKDFVRAENRTISALFVEHGKTIDYIADVKGRTDKKLKYSEAWSALHQGIKIEAWLYQRMTKELNGYATANISESNRRMKKTFDLAVKNGLEYGAVALPTFRDNSALNFRGSSVKLKKETEGENDYFIDLVFKPKEHLHCNLLIRDRDGNIKAILDRIYKGIYKLGTAAIIKRRNKYFLQLCYNFSVEDSLTYHGMPGIRQKLDPLKILGVDLGLAKPIAMQPYDASTQKYLVSDTWANTEAFIDQWCVSGDRINNFRRQIEKKKFAKQQSLREISPARSGKGREKRMRPLESYRDKISNFRKTTNFTYASRIVKMALRYGCGTIQMEDLTIDVKGRKSERYLKTSWTYYDLQEKIINKAAEFGIVVIKVKPAYTSQRCSKCGYIDAENRKVQATFKCQACGYEMNADLNAARNIAVPHIDKIISDALKSK